MKIPDKEERARLQKELDNTNATIAQLLQKLHNVTVELNNTFIHVLDNVEKTDEWKQLKAIFPDIKEDDLFDAVVIYGAKYDPEGTPTAEAYLNLFSDLSVLLPYIPDVLEAYKKITGLEEITFLQFMDPVDPVTGEPAESLFNKCLRQAEGTKTTSLQTLKSIKPENYIIPNSIVNNMMVKGLVNAGPQILDPSRNHKESYHVYAAITLDPNQYAVDGTFTKYDRRVSNGYCSLMEAGNKAFTSEMVYRAMNGLSNSEKVTPQQAAAVTRSINKQRKIDISIDATEEFKKRKIIDPNSEEKVILTDYCLNAKIITVMVGGKKKSAYMPTGKPILYDYSEKLNQIISVDSNLLAIKDETGGRISNTDNFAAIREYLLQRIEQMKSEKRRGKKVNNVIKIDTFYEETETNTSASKYKTRSREQAKQCLDYWKRCEYIKDYEFTKKGKTIYSVKITL